jgi:hypothetical protein
MFYETLFCNEFLSFLEKIWYMIFHITPGEPNDNIFLMNGIVKSWQILLLQNGFIDFFCF